MLTPSGIGYHSADDLLFVPSACILGGKMMNGRRHFFGFTYRYWCSIAALADGPVHL